VKPEEERRDIRSHVRATWYQVDRRNPEALDGGFAVGRPIRVLSVGQPKPAEGITPGGCR